MVIEMLYIIDVLITEFLHSNHQYSMSLLLIKVSDLLRRFFFNIGPVFFGQIFRFLIRPFFDGFVTFDFLILHENPVPLESFCDPR